MYHTNMLSLMWQGLVDPSNHAAKHNNLNICAHYGVVVDPTCEFSRPKSSCRALLLIIDDYFYPAALGSRSESLCYSVSHVANYKYLISLPVCTV